MASHKVTNATLDLIRQFEGLSLTAYWDVTRYSIGYGSGYLANGKKVQAGDSISLTEAETLLLRDVKEAGAYVNSLVKSSINTGMFDALTSFVYNVGVGNFEKSTLLQLVNQNPYNFAAIENAFREPQWCTYNRAARRQTEAYVYAQPVLKKAGSPLFWIALLLMAIYVSKKKGRN